MNEMSEEKYRKYLKAANILFIIGTALMLIGSFSTAAKFKFIPRWVESLVVFAFIAFILFFVVGLLTKKHDKSYIFALITIGLVVATSLVSSICNTSTDPLYRSWSKGLEYSSELLLAIYYFYYLQASAHLLKAHNQLKNLKKITVSSVVFFAIYAAYFIIGLISKMSVISHNIIANRAFSYGIWITSFVLAIYALVLAINITIGMRNIRKEVVVDGQREEKTE